MRRFFRKNVGGGVKQLGRPCVFEFGKDVRWFPSVSEASDALGLPFSTVWRNCSNQRDGFRFVSPHDHDKMDFPLLPKTSHNVGITPSNKTRSKLSRVFGKPVVLEKDGKITM